MTLVRTLQTHPKPDGTRRPAKGFFIWTPTERRIIVGSPDEVVQPAGFVVELDPTGGFEVDVAPTDLTWVWRVDERIEGLKAKTIYVIVPTEGPVDYTDLVLVNPASLLPQAKPANIWYTYTDTLAAEAQAAKVTAQGVASNQITTGVVDANGDLIFTKSDGTTFNAGRVILPTRLTVGTVTTGP